MGLRDCGSSRMPTRAVVIIAHSLTTGDILCCIVIILHDYTKTLLPVDLQPILYNADFAFNDLTNSRARVGLVYRSGHVPSESGFCEQTMTYLSPGETGSFLSTSFPPFANMKCPRFVLPCGFFAPRAATRTRSGSDSRGYGNSFCVC